MNAKELYQIVGQIDDDLILAANQETAKSKRSSILSWTAAAAACFCLILGGAFIHTFGIFVTWNEGTTNFVAKASIPENSLSHLLTDEALTEYYELTLPETISGAFHQKESYAQIYTDSEGTVIFDRNLIRYESTDGTQSINLTLSRVSSAIPVEDSVKFSRIHGITVAFVQDTSVPGYLLLGAQWEQNGTQIQLSAEGLEQKEVISIIKELIP